jgi:hypothetical protein
MQYGDPYSDAYYTRASHVSKAIGLEEAQRSEAFPRSHLRSLGADRGQIGIKR